METEITVEDIRKSLAHSGMLTTLWDEMSLEEQEDLAKHFFWVNGVPLMSPEFLEKVCSPEIVEQNIDGYKQRLFAALN